ncbi:MAG: hypothetical protein ACPL7L_02970, partial [bacterium]
MTKIKNAPENDGSVASESSSIKEEAESSRPITLFFNFGKTYIITLAPLWRLLCEWPLAVKARENRKLACNQG